jgi:predicted Zn-dependent peptidase
VPFDAAALERLRWAAARDSNLRYRTTRDLARALFDSWNRGWSPASLDERPARLAAVTLPDLERALRTCRASAVLSIVGDTRALPPVAPVAPADRAAAAIGR